MTPPEPLTPQDFETRYDADHTFPFFETEEAWYVVGYGHWDPAEFAAAVNGYYDHCGADLHEDDRYTARDVMHGYAVRLDEERFTWGGITAETPGAAPISFINT